MTKNDGIGLEYRACVDVSHDVLFIEANLRHAFCVLVVLSPCVGARICTGPFRLFRIRKGSARGFPSDNPETRHFVSHRDLRQEIKGPAANLNRLETKCLTFSVSFWQQPLSRHHGR